MRVFSAMQETSESSNLMRAHNAQSWGVVPWSYASSCTLESGVQHVGHQAAYWWPDSPRGHEPLKGVRK